MKIIFRILTAGIAVLAILLVSFGTNAQPVVLSTAPWVTPLEIDFGPVGVGSSAPQMVVTITNIDANPLTGWAGGAVPAPFNASQDCNISGGVLPGHSCHYFFNFSPTTAGTFTATSSSSTSSGPITVIVHGTGVGPSLFYDAHSLDFGNVFTNGTPAVVPQQVVTITNTGMAPLTGWAGGAVPAPFNASQDCNIAGGVLPGHSCHYFFNYSPTTAGTFSATSISSTNGGSITVNVTGAAHTSVLAGGGQQVTPLSLDFGPVGVGNTAQLEVAVTNNAIFGNITGWAGGGVGAPFNGTQDCNIAGGLPIGATCHFYYTFSPTAAGPFTAVSTVSDSFGTFSINLQGTGLAPSWKADDEWLDFGPLGPDGTRQEIVTITNTGQTPLTGWAGGGVGAPFNGTQDCNVPGGLLPGNSCHFYYTFSPTAVGPFSTTSSFSTNAGPMSIKLQGEGLYGVFVPVIQR